MSYKIPICISGFERGDATCCGDPEGKTEGERAACIWRDRCAAFTQHLKDSHENLEDYVSQKTVLDENGNTTEYLMAHDFDAFIEKIDDLVKVYGVKLGDLTKPQTQKSQAAPKPTKPKADKRKHNHPSRKAKAASRKRLRQLAKERRAQMRLMFAQFKKIVSEGLPAYKWAGPREAIAPGRLYTVDRLKPSRYMSVYCKALHGRDVPLALFRSKPQSMMAEIEMPTGPELFSNAVKSKLKPVPVKDGGRFKSRMKGLDKEGIAIAAEALLRLIDQDHIQLPPPRRRGPTPA